MSVQLTMRCALLLFAVALTQLVAGDQLKAICADDKKVELTSASELAALVSASSSQPDEAVCSPRIRAAIVELDQLVNSDNDNVCSPAKINQIRAYYTKFVDKKSLTSQHETKLPKALRDLFLSFGFGVSRLCKTSMISSLMSDAQSLLNEKDFEQVNKFTSDGSPLSKMIKKPKDVNDLVLPKDILNLLLKKKSKKASGDNVEAEEEKVFIVLQPATGKTVKKIQAVCARRFRPIYEQLILPLVSLSRVGLNYKGDDLADHLQEMKSNTDVHRWYRIVYLCESLSNAEIFEDPEGQLKGDKKAVRILTSEEADELRASQPTGELESSEIGEKINYQPNVEHKMDDLISDKADKNVQKLVGKFEAHKSESRRIRKKVMAQMVKFMKEFLKSGKMNVVRLLTKGRMSSMNDELVGSIDRQAKQLEVYENEDDEDESGALTRVKREWVGIAACVFLVLAAIACVGVALAMG